MWVQALLLLHMFGALDDAGNVTAEVGRPMSVYPLEPALSRMMVEAAR
jgi:HrpA-like RNA helicase